MRKSFLRQYGYTLEEIGRHMGITRERVRVLASKGSQRVEKAVKEMKKGGKK